MSRRKFKWSWRRVLSFGLAILLICGAIAGITALVDYSEDDKKTISPSFKIGGLSDEGVATDNPGSLYTVDSFEAEGLEIHLDFDSHLSYQLYFYTANDRFTEKTEVFTTSGQHYVAPGARVRVVLYPIWSQLDDDDQEIGWYEVWSYTSGIEIRISKNQAKGYTAKQLKDYTVTDGAVKNPLKSNETSNVTSANVKSISVSNTDGAIDAFYLDESANATQALQRMSVAVILVSPAGVKEYYYNGDNISAYPRSGYLPTREDPMYVPKGWGFCVVVNVDLTNADDLLIYTHG